MPINESWHLKHKMPKNSTENERTTWHVAHAKYCQCRAMPEKLRKLIKEKLNEHRNKKI